MDRGAWQVTAHGVTESDTIEPIEHAHTYKPRDIWSHQQAEEPRKDIPLEPRRRCSSADTLI